MAATSTNKQPLLVDRVLHYLANLDNSTNDGIDIVGANTASILINAIGTDGCIVEDIYSLSRSTTSSIIHLYMSTSSDYLRPNEAFFIGAFRSNSKIGERSRFQDMPKILAPVPQTLFNVPKEAAAGEPILAAQFRALYIPKGRTLWAARNSNEILTDGPLVGCQGGWF